MNPTTAHHRDGAALTGPGIFVLFGLLLASATALLGCSAPSAQSAVTPDGERAGVPPGAGSSSSASGPAGTPALASLRGRTWRLAELAQGEPASPAAPITLTFGEGRIAGSTGCNRYFADVTSAAPGTLRIGPVAATKRACQEPAMSAERRYLEALGKVSEYVLEGENLVLRFRREDTPEPGRLLFIPGPPDPEAAEELQG